MNTVDKLKIWLTSVNFAVFRISHIQGPKLKFSFGLKILFFLFFLSCNETEEEGTLGYKLAVEEITTYDAYKKVCNDHCFFDESVFNLDKHNFKIYNYTFTKTSSQDDYIVISQEESYRAKSFYFLNELAILCMHDELKSAKKKDRNHIFTNYLNYYSDGVKYLKLKKNQSVSTLDVSEVIEKYKISNCVFVDVVKVYSAKKNKFVKLYIDMKKHKLHASFESILKEYDFKLSPNDYLFNHQDVELDEIGRLKKLILAKNAKILEITQDTFIGFECWYDFY